MLKSDKKNMQKKKKKNAETETETEKYSNEGRKHLIKTNNVKQFIYNNKKKNEKLGKWTSDKTRQKYFNGKKIIIKLKEK